MNVALRQTWTVDQFLAWEERQDVRFEFDGVRPIGMVGVTENHAEIQANLIRAVGNRLSRPPCRIVGSDLKLRLASSVRYPDAMVLCSPRQSGRSTVTDPVIVFEIASDSTASTDLVLKNAEYRATPSIQRYVFLQQTHAAAVVFSRRDDLWAAEIVSGADAVLPLPEIGIDVPLAEIYRDVPLPPEDA